jgi:hypothetical protein
LLLRTQDAVNWHIGVDIMSALTQNVRSSIEYPADLLSRMMILISMFFHRAICTLGGFWLARRDLFTPMAAKGASQVILVSFLPQGPSFPNCHSAQNITLPALFFSKMVPSFNLSNIAALGES